MSVNCATNTESEHFYDSWIFTSILGFVGSVFLVWLLYHNDKTLTYISLGSLFLFFFYVLVIPVHLSRKVATEKRRGQIFYRAGMFGILLTLFAWSFVKIDYSFATKSFLGDYIEQMILLLGGMMGSALIVQAMRIWSDMRNKPTPEAAQASFGYAQACLIAAQASLGAAQASLVAAQASPGAAQTSLVAAQASLGAAQASLVASLVSSPEAQIAPPPQSCLSSVQSVAEPKQPLAPK